jgi:chitin disaccharide deacetylase
MKKYIVLCADDYGQAPAISQGIVTLIQNGRLSATSCMVNTPYWREHAAWLTPYFAQIDIGLHFNLTEGKPLSQAFANCYGNTLMPLSLLMRKAFFRQLDGAVIEAECQAQLDSFEQALGVLPRFVDGHQHVHQFPIVRDALLRVYEQRLRSNASYVRVTSEKIKPMDIVANFKKVMIVALGSWGLKRLLKAHHIPHNQTFAGIYNFSQAGRFGELFTEFLQKVDDGGLIMCHPGLASSGDNDAIAYARPQEYRYFFSGRFLEDCLDEGVTIKRFSQTAVREPA